MFCPWNEVISPLVSKIWGSMNLRAILQAPSTLHRMIAAAAGAKPSMHYKGRGRLCGGLLHYRPRIYWPFHCQTRLSPPKPPPRIPANGGIHIARSKISPSRLRQARLNLHLHLKLKLTTPNIQAANLKSAPAVRPNFIQVNFLRNNPTSDTGQVVEETSLNARHVQVEEASCGGRCPGEEARRRDRGPGEGSR